MAGQDGPMIGEKGKQYGLLIRKPAAAQPKLKSVFKLDDDTEPTTVNQQLSTKAQQQKSAKQASEQHKKALEADPTIFDYDGVVDHIQEKRETKQLEKTAEQMRRESKYVQQLMERAKIKKLEDELVYERQLIKERAVDEHLYGDKEKFMTTAYKEKLLELQKFKDEQAKRAAEDEKNSVEKRGNLSGFYGNFYNNENMGGTRKDTKPSAPIKAEAGATSGSGAVAASKSADSKRTEDSRPRSSESRSVGDGGEGRAQTPADDGDSKRNEEDSQRKREYTPGGTEVPWKRFKNPLAEKQEKAVPKLLPRLDDKEIEAARKRYLKRKAERETAPAV